jgi:hypothetical protein
MTLLQRSLSINESVVCAELDGEAVLLNVETGIYFGLDEVGTRIWNLLVAGAGIPEIVDRMLEEYEVDAEQLRADLMTFGEQLVAKGLAHQ